MMDKNYRDGLKFAIEKCLELLKTIEDTDTGDETFVAITNLTTQIMDELNQDLLQHELIK